MDVGPLWHLYSRANGPARERALGTAGLQVKGTV
jgi:hypothetical protein